ncbi:MAG: DUF1501 domain-containing protein [Planctomycetaceae bacterium]
MDDLRDRNLLDETLVIWTGEFGRTPKVGQVNSDAGASATAATTGPTASRRCSPAAAYAADRSRRSDKHAAYPAADPVKPVDLMATVHHLLGIPHHLELADSAGRRQVICPGDRLLTLL